MKKYLILLFSLVTVFGYAQTKIDPTLSPTTARINEAIQGSIATSGTDTYTGTLTGLTNVSGKAYNVTFGNANTGSATFNLNGSGPVTIRKFEGGTLVNLVAGDISAGETKRLRYNGTYLVIEGGAGGGGSGDFETMAGTPGAFSGNNLSYMRVSPGATQLEYRTPDGVASDLPAANTFTRGVLTASDWNTFNGKQSAITFGTGVQTALGVNIGSAGAPVLFNGALGTPSSGVGTNITGVVGTNVTNTPAGNIAATTVQAAINELDTEKENTSNKATSFSTLNNTLFPTNQAVSDQLLHRINIATITGSAGVDASISTATAVDRIPTTSTGAVATGTKVHAIIGGRIYVYELKAGTLAEASPYIIRANDYATTTNEKYWEIVTEFYNLYSPNITAYLGSSGSDASAWQATAIDRIPTTSLSVGARINAIVTISGTQRRLYTAELVTPADATAAIELSPSVIRPNDFNSSTNNKVWREIHLNGIVDVSNFGIVPDASVTVSDQINALVTAASAGDSFIFPASGGSSYKCFSITVNKKLHFIGNGATIAFQGLSANMFNISVDGTTVDGFSFTGQGRTSGSFPNQGGIRIASCSNVTISNCFFDLFPLFCIQTNFTHISDTSGDFGGISIVNCNMMRSGTGFWADTRGEYTTLVGCNLVDLNIGAKIGAGNIIISASNILDCSTVAIDLIAGTNDGHGIISNCNINHNVLSVRADGLLFGMSFYTNHIYYGDMELSDCNGLEFKGNTIEGSTIQWDNCTAGIFQDNFCATTTATVVLNKAWNGNSSEVWCQNNKDFQNRLLSGGFNACPLMNFESTTSTTNVNQVIRKVKIAEQETLHVEGTVTGFRTDASNEAFSQKFEVFFRRNTSGNVIKVGEVLSTAIKDGAFGGSISLNANTTDQTFDLQIVPEAAKNVTWVCDFKYVKTSLKL